MAVLLSAAVAGCTREPPARKFPLTGQVLAVKPDGSEITIRHDEVPGFMPPMTMPFTLKDRAQARGRVPGDLVKATLHVSDTEAWLTGLERTGWAPFPEASESTPPAFELLKPGDPVPDETLVDQDGRSFTLSALRGSAVLLTFVYTRCPLPDFCPRMNRHFQAVQRAITDGRVRGSVRLLSVSFDPQFDTPAVLKAHAAVYSADPRVWTFATGDQAQLDALGGRLGLSVIRDAQNPASITHNLRTAVIDREGRLVRIFSGGDWTPDEAVAAMAALTGS